MNIYIAVTVAIFVVLGAMLWDQLRLKQMTPFKWVIWSLMLVGLLANTWWQA